MSFHALSGVVAAMVTPRNGQEEIDFGRGFELIDFLCRGGVTGIALFTPIGEYASLSPADRCRFLTLAVKRSRVPVFAGVGAPTLSGALSLAEAARDADVCALLVPPPHGFAYGQDDVREFYLQFDRHAEDMPPIYLMDSPDLCTPFDPAMVCEIVKSGSFAGVADFLNEAACAVPEVAAAGDAATMRDFEAWMREFPGPAAVKTALEVRGIHTGPLAVPLSPEKQRRLDSFRSWFRVCCAKSRLSAHA